MRYGISTAAIIVQADKILLVHHRFNEQDDFGLPPGGKLEGDESIFDCAGRETFEETGLTVTLDRILYVQEFFEPGYHFCKFFILASAVADEITRINLPTGEDFLIEARFFTQAELQDLDVRPPVLKKAFWQELATRQPTTRYLGLHRVG
jgi:ADP-ribose pyrophosphatase YjhB (NUDIX family)